MKPFASPGGANTISGALMIVVLWYLWQFHQFDVPNEVVSAMQTLVNALFLAALSAVERLTGRDINHNGVVGNGHAKPGDPA